MVLEKREEEETKTLHPSSAAAAVAAASEQQQEEQQEEEEQDEIAVKLERLEKGEDPEGEGGGGEEKAEPHSQEENGEEQDQRSAENGITGLFVKKESPCVEISHQLCSNCFQKAFHRLMSNIPCWRPARLLKRMKISQPRRPTPPTFTTLSIQRRPRPFRSEFRRNFLEIGFLHQLVWNLL